MNDYCVIAASHRSGTTVLCHGLNQLDNVIYKGEVFRVTYEGPWRKKELPDIEPTEELPLAHGVKIFDDKTCLAILTNLLSKKKLREKRIIIKALAQQLPFYFYKSWQYLIKDEKCKIVTIKRNPIDIHVSLLNALANNKFHNWKKDVDKNETHTVKLDPWSFLNQIIFIDNSYAFFDFLKIRLGDRVKDITYDDICYNWNETIKSISEFIELEYVEVEQELHRQIPIDHHTLIDNYSNIKDMFKDTQFAKYFV